MQCIHNEVAVLEVREYGKGAVYDDNRIRYYRGPEEHHAKALCCCKGRRPFIGGCGYAEAVEKIFRKLPGFLRRHIFMILGYQGNVIFGGQVRDEGGIKRDHSQPGSVPVDKGTEFFF